MSFGYIAMGQTAASRYSQPATAAIFTSPSRKATRTTATPSVFARAPLMISSSIYLNGTQLGLRNKEKKKNHLLFMNFGI